MTDDELHAWIIGLIERDAMKQSGLIADEDLVAMGLQTKK